MLLLLLHRLLLLALLLLLSRCKQALVHLWLLM
jgi:hypothetical protein